MGHSRKGAEANKQQQPPSHVEIKNRKVYWATCCAGHDPVRVVVEPGGGLVPMLIIEVRV
jgi:hypothetical protein